MRLLQLPRKVAPGGVTVLHFFEPQDDWALAGLVRALSRSEIPKALRRFRVLKLEERRYRGCTAAGVLKSWHEFFVIAQRTQRS